MILHKMHTYWTIGLPAYSDSAGTLKKVSLCKQNYSYCVNEFKHFYYMYMKGQWGI